MRLPVAACLFALMVPAACAPLPAAAPLPTPSATPAPSATPLPTATPLDREGQEHLVYAWALNTDPGLMGFRLNTQPIMGETQPYPLPKAGDAAAKDLAALDKGTLADYAERNAQPHPLNSLMLTRGDYRVITAQRVKELFSGHDLEAGWQRFRGEENAQALVILSRAGMNAGMTEALVYLSYSCGPTCGEGFFYLLKRDGQSWAVIHVVHLWIS